jgi:5-methylcytosine-specific restriction endonuclease McrA
MYEVRGLVNLEKWIRQLLEEGTEYKFYKSRLWLTLRNSILEKYHYECQDCLKKGKVTRATTVHHINEVRQRPDLALSEYYFDGKTGERRENLRPLCHECHNIAHGRMCNNEYKPQLNVERW